MSLSRSCSNLVSARAIAVVVFGSDTPGISEEDSAGSGSDAGISELASVGSGSEAAGISGWASVGIGSGSEAAGISELACVGSGSEAPVISELACVGSGSEAPGISEVASVGSGSDAPGTPETVEGDALLAGDASSDKAVSTEAAGAGFAATISVRAFIRHWAEQ